MSIHETNRSHALLFTSERRTRRDVVSLLERRGVRVTERPVEIGLDQPDHSVVHCQPDLILIERSERCPYNWQKLTKEVRIAHPETPLILLVEGGSEEVAVDALRLGVRDYLPLPVEARAFFESLDRCFYRRALEQGRGLRPAQDSMDVPSEIVGSSESLRCVKGYMKRAAASDCTVLITGETGTGKELAAEFIHSHSARRNKPFVCVNCAAIPDPLLESELFGHTRGAFTGADSMRDGLLAAADGGTVLLDEIGDMSLSAQAKILRVLEKKEVSQLGGTQQRRVNIRFVAATNQDLETMADRGTFRKDLFYRLNVARVELPPLRDRKEDIPLLVEYYRHRLGGEDVATISEDCLRCLCLYDWPGNIRELKNVLESIFLHCPSGEARTQDLPKSLRDAAGTKPLLEPGERERLVEALCATHWNKSRAAEKLHWSRMTLYRKMTKHHVSQFPPNQRGQPG
jgi:DNA-binding NtrC family response regulator